jgi:two-component system alkaline phosphatase synthesis response regulator PhoP
LADPPHPGRIVVIHPDPRLRAEIVDAFTARGYSVLAGDPAILDPEPQIPPGTVVIAHHTQLPIDFDGQVLALVSTDEHGAILAAFAAGADDVLAGALRPTELVARVAILARTASHTIRLTVGPITIDTLARTVTLAGQPLELTPVEYQLLTRLATAPGRVFTKLELLQAIPVDPRARPSNPGSARPHRRVDTQVARLRRRLGDHRGLLVTVWGVGYRLG